MKHNHSCECPHDEVRYCKKCKVVHCLSCNQEWRTYPNWTYTYGTYPYTTVYGSGIYSAQGGGTALQAGQNNNTLNDGHTVTCNHQS